MQQCKSRCSSCKGLSKTVSVSWCWCGSSLVICLSTWGNIWVFYWYDFDDQWLLFCICYWIWAELLCFDIQNCVFQQPETLRRTIKFQFVQEDPGSQDTLFFKEISAKHVWRWGGNIQGKQPLCLCSETVFCIFFAKQSHSSGALFKVKFMYEDVTVLIFYSSKL